MKPIVPYPQTVIDALNENYAAPKITKLDCQDRVNGAFHAISLLPERMQFVIQQYYGNRKTYEQIGREMKITRQRVHMLCQQALKQLMNSNKSIYLYYGLEGAKIIIDKANDVQLRKHDDSYMPEPDYISKLGFSKRTYNALTREGITTIGQLISLSDSDLMSIKSLGTKSIAEIQNIAKEYLSVYTDNETLFNKIDKSNDFTEREKEIIKAAFSELQIIKNKMKNWIA